jgi:RHS repeat-associated protein
MIKKLIFSFLFFSFLSSDSLDEYFNVTIDKNNLFTIENCLNLLTGQVYFEDVDIIAEGKEPIEYGKSYNSLFSHVSLHEYLSRTKECEESVNSGWGSDKHINAYIYRFDTETKKGVMKTRYVDIYEPNGGMLRYEFPIINHPSWTIDSEKKAKKEQAFAMKKAETKELKFRKDKSSYQKIITSAFDNYDNTKVIAIGEHALKVYLANGTVRYYYRKDAGHEAYELQYEILPNGNIKEYKLKWEIDKEILTKSPTNKIYASLKKNTKYTKKHDKLRDQDVTIETNSNKKAYYKYHNKRTSEKNKRDFCLTQKQTPIKNQFYDYYVYEKLLLKDIKRPNDRVLNFSYESNKKEKDIKRVIEIKANLDSKDLKTLYKIKYDKIARFNKNDGITTLIDSLDNESKYYFSEKFRLYKIENYEKNNNSQILKKTQKFIYGDGGREGFLLSKMLFDENNKLKKAINYTFDDKGNILKEITIGNISDDEDILIDSSGFAINSDNNSYVKSFSYYDNNFLKSITYPNGLEEHFTYHKCNILGEDFTTNLVTSKLIKYKNKIKQRFFYIYDEDNLLTSEIIDDGKTNDSNELDSVNRREIKKYEYTSSFPFGQIETYEKYYLDKNKEERLIQKEKYEYSIDSKIIKKTILDPFDKENVLYAINYSYDQAGNLLSITDPVNREKTFKYDENFNKIKESNFDGLNFFYKYDNFDRLINKTIKDQTKDHKESYFYNTKSNLTSKTDIFGNISSFSYDFSNNLITEIKAKIEISNDNYQSPISEYKYDPFNRVIEKKDPNNNIIKIKYNIFDKPIEILYEDNIKEIFFYNLGNLITHIDKKNTKTKYFYDYLNRITSLKIFSKEDTLLKEEFFEYDSFDLIKKIDTQGNYTIYSYDLFNRKIKEKFFDNKNTLLSKIKYVYDSLGNISKQINAGVLSTVFTRDKLNRIIKQEIQNKDKEVLRSVSYEYIDEAYYKTIKTTTFVNNQKATDIKKYDIFDRLIFHADALDNETNITYDLINKNSINFLQKQIINPLKQKTIELYDAGNNLRKKEKFNLNNETIFLEEYFYDLNCNLTNHLNHIYNGSAFMDTTHTKMDYDNFNRLSTLIEAYGKKDKTTKYEYDENGNKLKLIKAGSEISYEYDEFNNNTRVYSNDIDYRFIYNELDQIIKSEDIINKKETKREYDAKGNLLKEKLSNGLSIKHAYDLLSNKIKTTYHTKDYVEYFYNSIDLLKITKRNESGNEEYSHEFLKYDLMGNLLEEKTVLNHRNFYEYDKLSRKIALNTSFHSQNINYDEIGRIKGIENTGFLEDSSSFEYDDLNQIKKEKSIFKNEFKYDSNFNIINKNNQDFFVNELNQITKIEDDEFLYDDNGNLIFDKSKNERYFYDSLDRLIKIEKDKEYILEYDYDPFDRRVVKKKYLYGYVAGYYLSDTGFFYYDNLNDIGSFDDSYNLKELRVLTNDSNAEPANGVSFEIGGYVYEPIYDVSKNIESLVYKDYVYEHYRYSAFGESKIYDSYKHEIVKSGIDNPWQFSSKRLDENGFIYFLRRYYSPKLCKWVTKDPKGFVDGYNLYAYVMNDPLVRSDLYGLFADEMRIASDQMLYNAYLSNNSVKESNNFEILPMVGNTNNSIPIHVISGQANTRSDHIQSGQVLYNNIQHISPRLGVSPIYTGSNGIVADSILSVAQRMEFYRPKRLDQLENYVKSAVKNLGNSDNPNEKSIFVCFSRGALDMYQVLERLDKETKNKIICITAGFAKAIPKDFAFFAKNIQGDADLLPSFMDHEASCGIESGWGYAKKTDKYDVDHIPQNGYVNGHRFIDEGYQEKIDSIIDEILKSKGLK